jgi:hypothetical protein
MALSFKYPQLSYKLTTGYFVDISLVITNGPVPADISFNISQPLPSPLTFDLKNGNITGTTRFSSISPFTAYIITAKSSIGGFTKFISLTISIDFTPEFYYPLTPTQFPIDQSLNIVPNYLINNLPNITYSIVPDTPLLSDIGLDLKTDTGIISGIPDTTSSNTYIVRANNNGITYDASLNISILQLPIISYSQTTFILTQNEQVNILPLINQIGVSYFISECNLPSGSYDLPFGLSFNTATGEISGIPTILTTFRSYRIFIINIIGYSSVDLILNVVKEFIAPPVLADNFSSNSFLTNPILAMRRKAEILQYKKNSSNLTKQQYLSLLAQGKGPYAKRGGGTQGDAFTDPNVTGLPQVGNRLICNSDIICTPTSSSDVPGPVMNLCYNPAIPVIGYNPPNRQKINIGFKWPQRAWKTGDNGFPVGKAGNG